MKRLYNGIPFLSLSPKTSEKVFIEKIYFPFGAFLPIYLKTFSQSKGQNGFYNKNIIKQLNEHEELYVKDDSIYLEKTRRRLGSIKELARFILDNNLISLDIVSPGCHLADEDIPNCAKAILGFNYKTRKWFAYIDGEVISVGIGDEILLVKDNVTIKLTTSLDVRKVIEIFAIGKINSVAEKLKIISNA